MSSLLLQMMAAAATGSPLPVNSFLLAIGGDATLGYLQLVDFSTGVAVDQPLPLTMPSSDVNALGWSPDGRYLAVGCSTSPYLLIYDCTTSPPTKLADPAVLPGAGSASGGIAWSPDGRYLTFLNSLTSGTKLFVYDWQTGAPVALSAAATQPGGIANRGARWDITSSILAVGSAGTPFVQFYEIVGGVLTKMADPATIPSAGASPVWHPWSPYCAVSQASAPRVMVYDFGTGSPVKLADPSTLPALSSQIPRPSWSIDGRYLLAGQSTSFGPLLVYELDAGVLVPIVSAFSLGQGSPQTGAWRGDTYDFSLGPLNTGVMRNFSLASGSIVDLSKPSTGGDGYSTMLEWDGQGDLQAMRWLGTPVSVTVDNWATGSPVNVSLAGIVSGFADTIAWQPQVPEEP